MLGATSLCSWFPQPSQTSLSARFTKLAITSVFLLSTAQAADINFELVQPELFSAAGGLSNAWGDYDNDGDLDLIVTFRDTPVRLYQNTPQGFEDVGEALGLPTDGGNPRSVAWGDYDGDGDLDVYFGYHTPKQGFDSRLYRNDLETGVSGFTEVGESVGAKLFGQARQVSFVDYDADGDLDIYLAFRAGVNRLLQNNEGVFSDVTRAVGISEPRRTVGACWFDMDADGDLDLFTANQNGDRDGMFRNDHGHFSDVAMELNIDQPRRPIADGSVGCSVVDFDVDGDLDLHVAEYGHDSLYRNNGGGSFTDVAADMGIDVQAHMVTSVWGDVQNDGLPDLYVVGYLNGKPGMQDYLFVNLGDRFENHIPPIVADHDADHGAQWVDFDQDGDLDLALTTYDPAGGHYLFRNTLSKELASRSIQVLVLDDLGHYTRAGSEVRIFRAGTDELLGSGLVDTASGYNSQNAKPVHFGLPDDVAIDVQVTVMTPKGRKTHTFFDVDWQALSGKPFVVKVGL